VTKIFRSGLERSRRGSSSLTIVGLAMGAMLPVFLAAMLVDQRLVLGAPVWLKPAKFAASTSIYALTTGWILSYLGPWTRVRRIVGGTIAVVFVVEVALIALQAARGTTSHFNIATSVDASIFAVMGVAILAATVAAAVLSVAAFRHQFDDQAMGWAIRLGLAISLAGSMVGGMMTRPTRAQLDAARSGARLTVAGAHTVGAPDGGPGLPGTGWSLEHGDLRVPHFVGLHALQALPIVAVVSGRRQTPRRRSRLVIAAAGAYAALFVILLAQALTGQSFVTPDRTMLVAIAIWLLATAMTVAFLARVPHDAAVGSSIHPEAK
jgi:hypothetical protein